MGKEFKVGNYIIRTYPIRDSSLTIGRKYKVISIGSIRERQFITILNDNNHYNKYWSERFKLYIKSNYNTKSKCISCLKK